MREFFIGLAYYLDTNIPSVRTFFLTPTILAVKEIYFENTGERGKNKEATLRVELNGCDNDLVKEWKKYKSFIFLLH